MDRRAFLSGLLAMAGVPGLTAVAARPAQAAPIARALTMPRPESAEGASAPDGTPVETAQWGPPPRERRYWRRRRRRWRRRHSRIVCRTYWHRGRRRRRCWRVYHW